MQVTCQHRHPIAELKFTVDCEENKNKIVSVVYYVVVLCAVRSYAEVGAGPPQQLQRKKQRIVQHNA